MKNIIAYIGLGIIIIGLFYILRNEKQKTERLYNSIDAIIKGNEHSKDSLIISNKAIQLEIAELKQLYPDIKKELKEVNINVKDVKQYQRMQLEVSAKFTAQISKLNDTTLLGKYTDKYIKYLSTLNLKDSTEFIQMKMPVKLEEVVFNNRKKGFWNFILNKRELTQKIWTDNPYVDLEYNELIVIK